MNNEKKRKKKTYCKTCRMTVGMEYCPMCAKDIRGACLDCHKELVHDIIEDQNIPIIGGQSSRLHTPDYDEDAFKRSDN
jgi:predicted amidophosphoribosyltransferase